VRELAAAAGVKQDDRTALDRPRCATGARDLPQAEQNHDPDDESLPHH
jgi:hypothetical protein